jgi:hypothetical protein
MPNAPKTPGRNIRVDADLWERFGEFTQVAETDRSDVLRDFIRWYVREPGAKLPPRPSAEA